jgi:serine/threonine-protein kinase HipA
MQGELDVWMNGERVALWYRTRTGTPVLRYEETWLASPNVRPLSLSLPIAFGEREVRGPAVDNFFDNLLPESPRVRERVRRRFGTGSTGSRDLLAAIGRDCVGAVQLLPGGADPPRIDTLQSEALDDAGVAALLRHATSDAPDDVESGEELRISIAGAQEKTALLRKGRRWHRPLGTTPTTHILKLPLGAVGMLGADMSTSVENEWLCGRFLAELGLPVATSSCETLEGRKVLAVERFDRRWMDGRKWIVRLPQEDFCQCLGVHATRKYESDGGPGIASGLSLLSGSDRADDDRLHFALAQLAFWLLAAIDGHAKNFSVFLLPGGAFQATPLYDVLSAWPIIGDGPRQMAYRRAKLAMAMRSKNSHYLLHEIRRRHFERLAAQTGVAGAYDAMESLVTAAPDALDRVEGLLPDDFPQKVWRTIRAGVLAQVKRWRAERVGD